MAEDTIQFNFSSIPFVGREQELNFLHENYRLASNAAGPEVVLVSGEEGVGKTALVNELRQYVYGGYFITGCFSSSAKPYEALVGALITLCDLLIANNEVHEIRTDLKNFLGGETAVLARWLPNLQEQILGEQPTSRGHPEWECNEEWAFGRLKYSLRAFLRSVCSPIRPIVMFLDNLDQANDECLDIITNILIDLELDGFLFIGANRPIGENHRLTKAFKKIETKNKGVSRLVVRNLEHIQLQQLVYCVTTCDHDTLLLITKSIKHVANGNPFYSIDALKTMKRTKSRNPCQGTTKSRLLNHCSSTAQSILRIASQLEASFDVKMIRTLLGDESDFDVAWNDLLRGEVIRESRTKAGNFEFYHQIYKEAVLMIAFKASPSWYLAIGKELQRLLLDDNTPQLGTFILAADHLNQALSLLSPLEKIELAQMNLNVAKSKMKYCALRSALKSLQAGLRLIDGADTWATCYDLKLQLMTHVAKVLYGLGMLDDCQVVIQDILSNSRCINDKIPLFFLRLETLGAQWKLAEGVEVGIGMLKELGDNIRDNVGNIYLLREYFKVKKMLRGKSDHDFMAIPTSTDELATVRAHLACIISTFAYQCAMPERILLLCNRMILMVIKDGLTPYSPFAFACHGLICGWSGDFERGYRFGCLAEKMLDFIGTCFCYSRTITITQTFLIHLKKPLVQMMPPLCRAWRSGLEAGDLHFAQFAFNTFVVVYFFTGQSLSYFIKKWTSVRSDSSMFKQQLARQTVVPYYQAAVILYSGNCKDPLLLDSSAMDEKVSLEVAIANKDEQTVGSIFLIRLVLSCFFGDWKVAGEMSDKICSRPKNVDGCNAYVCPLLFFVGLSAIRLSKERKYKRRSLKVIKELRLWERRGAVQSCSHFLLLLKAEQSAFEAKKEDNARIRKLYDNAIDIALKLKLLHIAALGCDLAGGYFKDCNDESLSSCYFRRAFALYDAWGAATKCESLKNRNGALLGAVTGPSSEIRNPVRLAPSATLSFLGGDIYLLEQAESLEI